MLLDYADGGFTAETICDVLIPAIIQYQPQYFLYGSGFETQPELLDEISKYVCVLGNSAKIVAAIKDPVCFFSACDQLDIPHPVTVVDLPLDSNGWIAKQIGGSGGLHIRADLNVACGDVYYQQHLEGLAVSVLFFSNGIDVQLLGFHRQLNSPYGSMQYRYGGLVGGIKLAVEMQQNLKNAVIQLCQFFGLRGLNSLDCMVSGESFSVLEVNPRLSASFGLYLGSDHGAALIKAHIDIWLGDLSKSNMTNFESVAGHGLANLVFYAPFTVKISSDVQWPDWVVDRPLANTEVPIQAPLCSIVAEAIDDIAAEQLARNRVVVLCELIEKFN